MSPADLEAVLRRYHKKYRLGDILVETNVISETQLQLGVRPPPAHRAPAR